MGKGGGKGFAPGAIWGPGDGGSAVFTCGFLGSPGPKNIKMAEGRE